MKLIDIWDGDGELCMTIDINEYEYVNLGITRDSDTDEPNIYLKPGIHQAYNVFDMETDEDFRSLTAEEEEEVFAFAENALREDSEKNTKFEYMYRDADNYKLWKTVVAKGVLSPEQIGEIIDSLSDGEFFLPEKVGLSPLSFEDGETEADHPWHTLYDSMISETEERPTISMTAAELHDRFVTAKWEISENMERK